MKKAFILSLDNRNWRITNPFCSVKPDSLLLTVCIYLFISWIFPFSLFLCVILFCCSGVTLLFSFLRHLRWLSLCNLLNYILPTILIKLVTLEDCFFSPIEKLTQDNIPWLWFFFFVCVCFLVFWYSGMGLLSLNARIHMLVIMPTFPY